MAKFYLCTDDEGYVFDCTLQRDQAVTILRAAGGGTLTALDVAVSVENVKKLLGNMGGYAKSMTKTTIKGNRK